jgi:hypothetical protein
MTDFEWKRSDGWEVKGDEKREIMVVVRRLDGWEVKGDERRVMRDERVVRVVKKA